MSQKKYILKMLKMFGMSNCKPRYTPCEPKLEINESDANEVVNPKYVDKVCCKTKNTEVQNMVLWKLNMWFYGDENKWGC